MVNIQNIRGILVVNTKQTRNVLVLYVEAQRAMIHENELYELSNV